MEGLYGGVPLQLRRRGGLLSSRTHTRHKKHGVSAHGARGATAVSVASLRRPGIEMPCLCSWGDQCSLVAGCGALDWVTTRAMRETVPGEQETGEAGSERTRAIAGVVQLTPGSIYKQHRTCAFVHFFL